MLQEATPLQHLRAVRGALLPAWVPARNVVGRRVAAALSRHRSADPNAPFIWDVTGRDGHEYDRFDDTDSIYVRDGITKWLPRWKANGWQTAAKQPVKNVDLWQRLDAAVQRHDVQWHWVKGHAGHPENERADRLAARGLQEALASTVRGSS